MCCCKCSEPEIPKLFQLVLHCSRVLTFQPLPHCKLFFLLNTDLLRSVRPCRKAAKEPGDRHSCDQLFLIEKINSFPSQFLPLKACCSRQLPSSPSWLDWKFSRLAITGRWLIETVSGLCFPGSSKPAICPSYLGHGRAGMCN